MNGTPAELRLEGSWSFTEEAFGAMVRRVEAELGSPRRIVEFGGGPSTVRLALAFPGAFLESVESHGPSYESTRTLLGKYGVEGRVELRKEKLAFLRCGEVDVLTYCGVKESDGSENAGDRGNSGRSQEPVDCVIIDGPSFFTLRGREACLYQVNERLRTGGLVFLDDHGRRDEKRIVRNWMEVYPGGYRLEPLRVGHGLAVLRKIAVIKERWGAPGKRADDVRSALRYDRIRAGLEALDDRKVALFLERVRHLRHLGLDPGDVLPVLRVMREAYGIPSGDGSRKMPLPARLELVSLLARGLFNL
jgi:hypothetical protein